MSTAITRTIKSRKVLRGLTDADLATASGLKLHQLRDRFSGRVSYDADELARISKALGYERLSDMLADAELLHASWPHIDAA